MGAQVPGTVRHPSAVRARGQILPPALDRLEMTSTVSAPTWLTSAWEAFERCGKHAGSRWSGRESGKARCIASSARRVRAFPGFGLAAPCQAANLALFEALRAFDEEPLDFVTLTEDQRLK